MFAERKRQLVAVLAFAGVMASCPVPAVEPADYTVADLLKPCMEGDNASRWGEVAELECEQYINGFSHALVSLGDNGPAGDLCLPTGGSAPDEIRWAFMKWAHDHYDERRIPAAEGLMRTLQAAFPCQ